MSLNIAVRKGFKANLFWGVLYSGISALVSYAMIRVLPGKDFAAYASATAASNIGVVLVEGGLTLGFTRYLVSAVKGGIGASLYSFVLKRRILMGALGCALLALWSAFGLGHHALLDGYVGRWVWVCIAFMFFGELFSLLPYAGLQALFEYQYSLSTRAAFVTLRGALVILGWLWLHSLYVVFILHGCCVITEGLAYHFLLRRKLTDQGQAPAEMRQQVVHYGYFSIAEKGAHAVGGINGIFLILGYLLPALALGPIAVAKELAQRIFSLAILPINNLTNSVLNWSADSADLPKVASRSLALMAVFVLLVSGVALGLMNSVLPALKLATDPLTMACAVVVLSGIMVEYVLRYDQSYRFRRGLMGQAVVWAYASTVAAVGLTIWWAPLGPAAALAAYFCGRLTVLACAMAYKLTSRYELGLLGWLPLMIAIYAATMATLLWKLNAYWQWLPLSGMFVIAMFFYRSNRDWLDAGQFLKRKKAS